MSRYRWSISSVELFLVAIIAFGVTAHFLLIHWRASSYRPVAGRVVSANVVTTSERTAKLDIQVEYRVDGHLFRGGRYSPYDDPMSENKAWEIIGRYPVGLPTTIYVSPNDPTQSVLTRDLEFGYVVVLVFFDLLALLALISGIRKLKDATRELATLRPTNQHLNASRHEHSHVDNATCESQQVETPLAPAIDRVALEFRLLNAKTWNAGLTMLCVLVTLFLVAFLGSAIAAVIPWALGPIGGVVFPLAGLAAVFTLPFVIERFWIRPRCARLVRCPYCDHSLWDCASKNFKPRKVRLLPSATHCPSCGVPIV